MEKKTTRKPKQNNIETMDADKAAHQTGQDNSPSKTAECRNCKKRGHYEKMCRSMKEQPCQQKKTIGSTTESRK